MVGMPRSHVLSLWTLVVCLGLADHGAAQPSGPARLAVTEATLDNGLRVLIQEDPRNPIVAVQVFYRVGSRNERPGATGLAHFLEHMMFKGTPTRGRGEISRLIELNGGRDNAFTTKDMTGYHVNIAADRLDLVLTIEADRMRNLLLAPAEIDSERKVVMEERRTRIDDDPEGVVYEAMSSMAFLAHPYRWPIIGWMSDIEPINPAGLRAFYDTYYQPNNAILVIAGDVKAPDALALVRRHFGPIPRGADPAPVTALEPPQSDERRVIVRKEAAQLPVVNIAWHVPNFRSDDAPALEVLSMILSEGRASRLYRHLVYDKRMVLGAGGEYSYSSLDPTLFWFYATLLPGQTPEAVEQALLGEVEQLKKGPDPAQAAGRLARREVLPMGAVLLVAERPAIPIVVVRVSVPAGAVRDPADGLGLANLTADMLTRGTARRSGPALDQAIEFVGGSLEADAGRDSATITLSVLKKDLTLGLDLLAEVLRQPTFPADELTRKIADIQASLRRSEQSPETVAGRVLRPLIVPGHPYGQPVDGTVESVGNLTREQVVAFHRLHYRPDGANLVVVGDVTEAEIRRALLQRLAGWTAPA